MLSGLHIALASNSAWNLSHFRAPLLDSFGRSGLRVTALVPDGELSSLAARGIAVETVPLDRTSLSPFRDASLFLAYVRALKRMRPSVLLTFTAKPNIYGALAARACGIPVISNISGLGTGFLKGGVLAGILSALYRLALPASCRVFFQNPDDRALFVQRGIVRPERTEVLPGSGVDLDDFSNLPCVERGGSVRFLFLGRMLADKGVREFAQAASQLKAEGCPIDCVLVGPGEDANSSALGVAELSALGEKGAVRWLGPAQDVRPYLSWADVVVLPSYREGMPRSLIEAAAAGRPVITTDVPGCRQAVIPEQTGFLCLPRDSSSLAAAMRKMIALGSAGRAAFGAANRRRAEAEFGSQRIVDAYVAALADCLTVT